MTTEIPRREQKGKQPRTMYDSTQKTCLVGREDAGVELDVSRLVHAVNVSERSGDAEVGGDGSQGLLYSPDLPPKNDAKKQNRGWKHSTDRGSIEVGANITRYDEFRRYAIATAGAPRRTRNQKIEQGASIQNQKVEKGGSAQKQEIETGGWSTQKQKE